MLASISFYMYPDGNKCYRLSTIHKDDSGEITKTLMTLLDADQAEKFLDLRIVKVKEVEPFYGTLRLYGTILPPIPELRPAGGFGYNVSGLVRSLVHRDYCEAYAEAMKFSEEFNTLLENPSITLITTYSGKTFKQY